METKEQKIKDKIKHEEEMRDLFAEVVSIDCEMVKRRQKIIDELKQQLKELEDEHR